MTPYTIDPSSPTSSSFDVANLPSSSPLAVTPSHARKKRKRAQKSDPLEASLLQRLAEIRQEAQVNKNIFFSFMACLNTFLQELPEADESKLFKDKQRLMLNYY